MFQDLQYQLVKGYGSDQSEGLRALLACRKSGMSLETFEQMWDLKDRSEQNREHLCNMHSQKKEDWHCLVYM